MRQAKNKQQGGRLKPNYTRNYIKSRQLHTLIKRQVFGIKRKKYNPMLFIGYTHKHKDTKN